MRALMARPSRRLSFLTILVAVSVAASGARPAHASGQSSGGGSSSSSSDSSNSKESNSSNGSKDSSNSSKGTSDNSQASSKSSNDSTQNSPKRSSDYSTQHTTKDSSEWSTKTRQGNVVSIAIVVVSVGATVLGVKMRNDAQVASQRQAERALAEFMRRQHPLLTHDVVTGRGVVLAAWSHDLGLDAVERARLERALDGSVEQGALLEALDGSIDEARARRFAGAFVRLTARALGSARAGALVKRAVRATGAG
jgi:hypothetical protein